METRVRKTELLLACPFCGEDTGDLAPVIIWRTPKKAEWPRDLCRVECLRCHAQTGEFDYQDGAIKQWQMRSAPKSETFGTTTPKAGDRAGG
jgi:hypothetical protein